MGEYVGRLAPSPTGYLHLGNARTFLVTWLRARAQAGTLVLRMEDLNYPRVTPAAVKAVYDDLQWLGLDWDWGPPASRPLAGAGPHGSYVQSERLPTYQAALNRLWHGGHLYACVCTRKDILNALDAPHKGDELPYPNTCRDRFASPTDAERAAGRSAALRFRVAPGVSRFTDWMAGEHSADLQAWSGDFVVRTRVEKLPSYHLAVVVDDLAMGVTEVVRGADLLATTHRHLALYAALGAEPPRYVHVPLVRDAGGRRLAKRDGDTRIGHFRELGVPPERIVGWLAHSLRQISAPEPLSAAELLHAWDETKIPKDEVVVERADRAFLGL